MRAEGFYAGRVRNVIRNLPLPEPFLIVMAVAGGLHALLPWRVPIRGLRVAGPVLGAAGVGVIAWSVAASRGVQLSTPGSLVREGPYARTRNPMYLGWALLHLGAGIASRSERMLVSLPAAAGLVHREVLQEERMLGRAFPRDYTRYRMEVPRYLPRLALFPPSRLSLHRRRAPFALGGLGLATRRRG